MKHWIQRGLRRSRRADRVAWFLLAALTLVLVISVVAGFRSLGMG